jgi:hypothetical protein
VHFQMLSPVLGARGLRGAHHECTETWFLTMMTGREPNNTLGFLLFQPGRKRKHKHQTLLPIRLDPTLRLFGVQTQSYGSARNRRS